MMPKSDKAYSNTRQHFSRFSISHLKLLEAKVAGKNTTFESGRAVLTVAVQTNLMKTINETFISCMANADSVNGKQNLFSAC